MLATFLGRGKKKISGSDVSTYYKCNPRYITSPSFCFLLVGMSKRFFNLMVKTLR